MADAFACELIENGYRIFAAREIPLNWINLLLLANGIYKVYTPWHFHSISNISLGNLLKTTTQHLDY